MKIPCRVTKINRNFNKLQVTLEAPLNDNLMLLSTKEEYIVDIDKPKRKRSLTANAYAWMLCQLIAEELSKNGYHTKEDVYRKAIRESMMYRLVIIKKDFVGDFIDKWETRGVGWMADIIGVVGDEYHVGVYAGSSTFNTSEMARLIDSLVDECKMLGIETIDDRDIDSLVSSWIPYE